MKHILLAIIASTLVVACTLPNPPAQSAPHMMAQSDCPMMSGTGNMGDMMSASEYDFIREMIPHHQEAVDTARLTLATTENPELRALLENIITNQEREISMMKGWLAQWYPNMTTITNYKPMMGDLAKLDGRERDAAFLNGMIMHHHMAVMMANSVLTAEPRPEVRTFALNVVKDQSAEIGEMRTMLADYPESKPGCPMMH